MKEIKTFFRANKAQKITDSLDKLGVVDYTVTFVMGIGDHLADTSNSTYSIEVVKKYSNIAKLELVCREAQVGESTKTIQEVGYTGQQGDGIIYVTPVEKVIKIRTGAVNSDAL